jgi:predicted RNA-binding protein YlqC (UPF0109 family)
MEDLIENIVKGLVADPEEVRVERTEGDGEIVYQLEVGKDDLGKVIGRQGRTVRAIRTVVGAASARSGERTHVEILD